MKNPFIQNGYLLPIASVNRVKTVSSSIPTVNKLLTDEAAVNKYAYELVSGDLFKTRIQHLADDINGFILCLKGVCGEAAMREAAMREADIVVRRFARNLCYILLTLKNGSSEDRTARSEWTDEHWSFWNSIKKIYLCGGMTNGLVGERLLVHMYELFEHIKFYPYEIEILPNGYAAGLEGAKNMLLRYTGSGIVFDFGHTYVKRGCFRGKSLHILESICSMFVKDAESDRELFETALSLHNFIVNIIAETFADMGADTGSMICVVFANYINNGALYSGRGGYAKLSCLSNNYQDYLSNALKKQLNTPIRVILLHDGTAAAMGIGKDEEAAVVTLGTGLGVGFVDNSAV